MPSSPSRPEVEAIDALHGAARHGTIASALTALGRFAHGRPGIPILGGGALSPVGPSAPLLRADGAPCAAEGPVVPDPVLAEAGLRWILVPAGGAPPRRLRIGALALRAGLLERILDRAYDHLAPRLSAGEPVLRRQLVRAAFVEALGAADQARREAPRLLAASAEIDLDAAHDALSEATMRAAKLMGGHGYLMGAVNTTEFVSLCLAAMSRSTARTPRPARSTPAIEEAA